MRVRYCGAVFVVVLLALATPAKGEELKVTAEHPVPNYLQPTGKRRFFLSSRYFLRNWAILGLWKFNMTGYPTEHCVGTPPLNASRTKLISTLGRGESQW